MDGAGSADCGPNGVADPGVVGQERGAAGASSTKPYCLSMRSHRGSASSPRMCVEGGERGVGASDRMQLVVTTHSDALVSALSNQPEAIVACERPGSGTELRRLDPQRLASWLEDYRLGDLWRMGELGGAPVCGEER